jgi:hypothetical protein
MGFKAALVDQSAYALSERGQGPTR